MKRERTHKTEVSLNLIVRRADGSIKERQGLQPEPQKPDMVELAVRNKDGSLVSQKRFPCKSFVQNWSEMLYHAMQGATSNPTIKDTGGTTRTENIRHQIILEAADNTDVYGIWIGTGDTAVAVSDYALAVKVAHGTGAGQLDYNAMAYVAATMDGTDIVYKAYRTFVNSSGNTITIKEVGLISNSYTSHPYMVLRDVKDEDDVTIDVAVADGQTLTVTYIFTQTQASWFCKQYLQLMESMCFNQNVNIKYVAGSGATVSSNVRAVYSEWLQVQAAAGAITHGIVVGTNSDALDSTDYKLGAIIAHGSGSGQLSYAAVATEDVSVDGNNVTFVYKRTFTNNSGSTISIQEIGVYTDTFSGSGHRFMIIRSLTGNLVLEAGESVTAKYTFKHTV